MKKALGWSNVHTETLVFTLTQVSDEVTCVFTHLYISVLEMCGSLLLKKNTVIEIDNINKTYVMTKRKYSYTRVSFHYLTSLQMNTYFHIIQSQKIRGKKCNTQSWYKNIYIKDASKHQTIKRNMVFYIVLNPTTI